MIAIKRIYEAPSDADGTRVLIMRLWPRGIRKSHVDIWLKELGPVLPLMRAFRCGEIDWAEYRRRYRRGSRGRRRRRTLAAVRAYAKYGRSPCSAAAPTRPTVTGLCSATIC